MKNEKHALVIIGIWQTDFDASFLSHSMEILFFLDVVCGTLHFHVQYQYLSLTTNDISDSFKECCGTEDSSQAN